jgi:hypothetical protein
MGTGGRTIVAFGLLLMSACAAPTQISSNKAQDYTAQPTRLFVVTDVGSDFGNDFANYFQANLINIASDCGSAAEVSRISALELDDSTRRQEIDGFKPDVFIRFAVTAERYRPQLVDVIYDVRLVDIQTRESCGAPRSHFIGAALIPLRTVAQHWPSTSQIR